MRNVNVVESSMMKATTNITLIFVMTTNMKKHRATTMNGVIRDTTTIEVTGMTTDDRIYISSANSLIHPNYINHLLNSRAKDYDEKLQDIAMKTYLILITHNNITYDELMGLVDGDREVKWEEDEEGNYLTSFPLKESEEE